MKVFIAVIPSTMLDGNSEICVHVLGAIFIIGSVWNIWLDRKQEFFLRKGLFSMMRAQHVLSYHIYNYHIINNSNSIGITYPLENITCLQNRKIHCNFKVLKSFMFVKINACFLGKSYLHCVRRIASYKIIFRALGSCT